MKFVKVFHSSEDDFVIGIPDVLDTDLFLDAVLHGAAGWGEAKDTVEEALGAEWDEAEDVTEADLQKYGNGWFMWKKRGSKVLELATADNKGQLIPRPYTITKLFYTEMVYKEANSGKKRSFQKAND